VAQRKQTCSKETKLHPSKHEFIPLFKACIKNANPLGSKLQKLSTPSQSPPLIQKPITSIASPFNPKKGKK
jgi:hypothetical protein